MKATKKQSRIFCLGSLLIVVGLGWTWLPLGFIAAGIWLITLAVLQFNSDKEEEMQKAKTP